VNLTLLLENVALRIGNLQVIKLRCRFCCCEWLPLTESLGALIHNGMGNLAYVFLFLAYYIYEFSWLWFSIWNFMRRFDETFMPKTIMLLYLFRCKVLKYYDDYFWRINCFYSYLIILRNVTFRLCENSDWFLRNFYVWQNGVLHYNWYQSRSVGPAK